MNAIAATHEDIGRAAEERAAPALDPGGTAPILRLDAATVSDILDRFHDPALLAEGRVNVMALDAICARLGTRWGAPP